MAKSVNGFQYGEQYDTNNRLVKAGSYGKHTPFVTDDNTGILDYIIENFRVLNESINGSEGTPLTKKQADTLYKMVSTARMNDGAVTGEKLAEKAVGQKHLSDALNSLAAYGIMDAYTKREVDSTFAKTSDMKSTYLSKSDATGTYLSKRDAESSYVKKTDFTRGGTKEKWWVRFPNGFIIQGGQGDMNTSSKYIDVTYPITFKEWCYPIAIDSAYSWSTEGGNGIATVCTPFPDSAGMRSKIRIIANTPLYGLIWVSFGF